MNKFTRLPAIPLITNDPFFSIWDCGVTPNADDTRHWTGVWKQLRGGLVVDGKRKRFLGRTGGQALKVTGVEVTPLSTIYTYEDMGVRFTLRFTSPLLLDDLDILSTPISYVDFNVEYIDGNDHEVEVIFYAMEQICHQGEISPRMRSAVFADGDLKYAYLGQMEQKPLSSSGDHLTIDWGYLFFCTNDGNVDDDPNGHRRTLIYTKKSDKPFASTLMVGYDDIASINYFGRMLPAYYARNGKTITEAFREFHERGAEIKARCAAFDEKLLAEANEIGGEDYELIVCASYRHSIAAHKLVADVNGDILFISKENDSNGCAATVDVSYPSVPLYLLYAPELVRGMCRPIFKFTRMPIWHYDFAPHDAGRYPHVTGQTYAATKSRDGAYSEGISVAPYYLYPSSVDEYDFRYQMPVEECANMLLMLAAVCRADGDYSMAVENMDLLNQWCQYLLTYGEDPGDQLCTDDFAGHLARNVNLSAKAVMGIAAYADLLEHTGNAEEAAKYAAKAKELGESWLKRADVGGYTSLTFNGDGWSQKYNLVWDKLMGYNILPDSFYTQEINSYIPRINEYGLPLDSRATYTKSDWTMWVASMADDKETFCKFAAPMAKFLKEAPNRVPFSDYYDTTTAINEEFIGRSVQGGNFMPLLMKKWKK